MCPWLAPLLRRRRIRVVLLDQRGCGRSTPHASDPAIDLATNTTDHLIADIEQLREQLGVERWLVVGGSWGSTLALAYAERLPERVSEIVLFNVGTISHREVRWMTRELGRYFPDDWARFRDGVPVAEREGDLVAGYYRLLHDQDPAVREKAAHDWCQWEDAHVARRSDRWHDTLYDPRFRMAFVRLITHYWHRRSLRTVPCCVTPAARPAYLASSSMAGTTSARRSMSRGT